MQVEVARNGIGQQRLNRRRQTLHGGSNRHAVRILVDDGRLVGVNADHLAADLRSRFRRRGVDAAAASEHDFHALGGVPVVHVRRDVSIAHELAAVDVLAGDVRRDAQFHRRVIRALHEAVAEALHRRNLHAAEEAELLVAHLHCRIARHVAGKFFLIHSREQVGRFAQVNAVGGEVILAHVQRDELHVRVEGLAFRNRRREQVAGHDDDVVAFVDGRFNLRDALRVGVTGGLEVVEVDAVGLTERLAGLVGRLVEGLVGDVAGVGNHRHAVGFFRRREGNRAQHHRQRQDERNELLHGFILLS